MRRNFNVLLIAFFSILLGTLVWYYERKKDSDIYKKSFDSFYIRNKNNVLCNDERKSEDTNIPQRFIFSLLLVGV